MKKWSGGLMVTALALILLLSYTLLIRTKPTITSPDPFQLTVPPPKKPHLPALDDLYAPSPLNASEPLIVWAQMRSLLSRSDSLPETAQGLKEAAAAWKELVSTIQEKASADHDSCPLSVDAAGPVLELPCGLVEGSSISLLGGSHESFRIQLVGPLLPGESEAPVALNYDVSLPGDNMTQEPFIVQNSWTEELGWGRAERCPPSNGDHNSNKVDGLVTCNKRVLTQSDTQNATQSGRESSSFPFGEGIPFTATLWAGFEGFHMTVNGRHETSFAYREKLEPWIVSKVKVSGGLRLRSALAKDLPVSEDHDIVVDAEALKAPLVQNNKKKKKKTVFMVVGVFSTANNFERRMALRRSWLQYEAVRSGDVIVRFLIGLHKNKQVNYELWREAEAYGDVQLMPFVDYYSLISLKTIAICIMGTKIVPAKFIMKTDDDAFVRIDEVLSSLKAKPQKGLLYGRISFDSSPHRDAKSKWYISEEEWPRNVYPPWAHGPGYVISRDIGKFIVRGHHRGDLKLFKLEDVAMGIWIEELKKSGEEVQYVNDFRFHNAGCESNYVLAHYQSPRMVLCLWEKLLKHHTPICCE